MTIQSTSGELEAVSLAQMAYERIETMIVTGQLQPNSLISENELSKELGCGRTPIREALQRLRFTGLVDILPRRGVLVKPIDVLSQLDLLEVRRPLEELMVRLACRRASQKERDRMRELADLLENTAEKEIARQNPAQVNADLFLEINRVAHLLEANAARNEMLETSIGMVYSLSRRFWYTHLNDIDSFSEAARWRVRMLRAIANGQPDLAIEAVRGLLDFLERATRKAIDERYDQSG
jgi:DNA-binding GntR family transcriptional regulator